MTFHLTSIDTTCQPHTVFEIFDFLGLTLIFDPQEVPWGQKISYNSKTQTWTLLIFNLFSVFRFVTWTVWSPPFTYDQLKWINLFSFELIHDFLSNSNWHYLSILLYSFWDNRHRRIQDLTSGVTRNSGAPGQNIEWAPLNCGPWVSFLVGGTERGIFMSTHSTVSPGKVLKIDNYFDFGCLFCPLEFEHTFLCEIITYCNVDFGNYKICLELGGPQHSGAPWTLSTRVQW